MLADMRRRHAKHAGDVLVRLIALKNQLEDRSAVGRELIESRHSEKGNLPPVSGGSPIRVPLEATLDGTLGFEAIEMGEERVRGRVEVADRVRQPFGLVHGGVYAALSESLVSRATFEAVSGEGMLAVGLSNDTSLLRPITSGFVHATARRRHRGRTTWLWEVELCDDDGRLCALSRITMAIRPVGPA